MNDGFILKKINFESAYAYWEITETYEESSRGFDDSELESIASHHPKKQLEYLATRHLLKLLCEHFEIEYSGVTKDEFGKPHLNNSNYHISISHAFPSVVCMLHKSKPCGIDIETLRLKINRIKHKFLSEKELISAGDDVRKLSLFWSAKEALYKLYGRKSLLFIENIQVEFTNESVIEGRLVLDDSIQNHRLMYEDIGKSIVVYTE